MSFLPALKVPDRDPCDYNVQYLQKLKGCKESLVKTVKPRELYKFVPMFSSLSQYLESGHIMLIYKEMPDQIAHLKRMKENNRLHAIRFNEELENLKDVLSIEQMMMCNEIALTMLQGR